MTDNAIYLAVINWAGESAWAVNIMAIALVAVVCDAFMRAVLIRLQRRFASTATPWDHAVVAAIRAPASVLVWAIGLSIIAEILHAHFRAPMLDVAELLRETGIIGAIAWALLRLTRNFERALIARGRAHERKTEAAGVIGKLLRAAILIAAALMILQTIGVSIAGLLAFGGIGGIAVGFAARDVLANFFGGLMLHLDNSFAVGDWVRLPERDIEGTVEHLGWRLTRIRAFDMRPVYVPNGILANLAIINPSRMTNRCIDETFGVRRDDADKIASIVAATGKMLAAHADIDQSQAVIANFNRFAPSACEFFIYAYTRTTAWIRYHEVKQDVLLQVHAIIVEHGAQLAYPTSLVHIKDAGDANRFARDANPPNARA